MSSPRPVGSITDRLLPMSGAVYTALLVLAAAAFPAPPGGDVSPASHPGWLAAHLDAVIGQGYLRAFAALAFLVLTTAIGAACRRALPSSSALARFATVGGTLTGGLMLLAQATGLAAALFVHDGGGGDATRALGSLQTALLDMSAVPAVLLFAATGLAGLLAELLPRWLAVVSLAGVPIALIDAASYDGGPFERVDLLGLVYFLAWSLLVGVRLEPARTGAGTTGGEPAERTQIVRNAS